MTYTGPDGEARGIRRLPKHPGALARPVPSGDELREPSAQLSKQPPPELYFEPLPVPWAETSGEPEDFSWEPAPSIAEPIQPEDPSIYFRHSSQVRQAQREISPAAPLKTDVYAEAVPTPPPVAVPFRKPVFSREAMRPDASSIRPDSVPPAEQRVDPILPTRPSVSSRISNPDQPSTGDPKPAFARSSGVVRSRPTRASGSFAAARQSGEFPAARVSGEMEAAKTWNDTAPLPIRSTPVAASVSPARDPEAARRAASSSVPDGDSSAEQETAQSRLPGRGKSLVGMIFASVALVAYAFEIGPLEDAADAAARQWTSGGPGLLAGILPWLLVVPAIALFGLIVWLLAGVIGLRQPGGKARRARMEKRPKTPLDHFKQAAVRDGIDTRTAYRGWRLLEAACGGDRAFTVDSLLVDDLALTAREIRSVHLQLLSDLSRVADPAMRLPGTETVLDLLRAVETAPVARPSGNSGEVTVPGDPGQRRRKDSSIT